MTIHKLNMAARYPVCRKILGPENWQTVLERLPDGIWGEMFADILRRQSELLGLPHYVADLARIEARMRSAESGAAALLHQKKDTLCVNPTLSLLETEWLDLPAFILQRGEADTRPRPGAEMVLVWLEPDSQRVMVGAASNEDLLALKIVLEELDKHRIVESEGTTLAVLDRVLERAAARGLLLRPASSGLRREQTLFAKDRQIEPQFLATPTFTLQWHLTQACDLRCKHCYDRSTRSELLYEDAIDVLDQLYDFCQLHNVDGQVSFTGGNPLLHPDFLAIYRAAADRGLMTAILGNPTTSRMLSKIKVIQPPEFFQVSLEGMREHNDYIRGAGHFDRVMRFLAELKKQGIYSMVMLTLTRNNLDQVLPLAELLRDRTDLFTFNRLSAVGEGAQLQTPDRQEFETFLRAYLQAAQGNPAMALKDNLINIIRLQEGRDLFGGCAGFGCGAAFNFVALLPDGEVHACRKFSSPIGNILEDSLAAIYASNEARRYRQGPTACHGCRIRHVCGGCLAVIDSQGLDFTTDRDPCCFLAEQ